MRFKTSQSCLHLATNLLGLLTMTLRFRHQRLTRFRRCSFRLTGLGVVTAGSVGGTHPPCFLIISFSSQAFFRSSSPTSLASHCAVFCDCLAMDPRRIVPLRYMPR